VLTGAGISAESGVPTFRGTGGLWRDHRPEDLATPEAFARDPRLVWEWYAWRRAEVARCRPNPGHEALARWLLRRPGGTLVTQNVDTLHERAAETAAAELGVDPAPALPFRLHGSLAGTRCSACGRPAEPADGAGSPPRCRACGAPLRPDVVWFGELLPEVAVAAATRAAAEADVCLVIGTAGAVYPAAGFANTVARQGGALVVVDPAETAFDRVAEVKLTGRAGELLPRLLR